MTITITATSSGPYTATADTTFAVTFQSAGEDQVEVTLEGAVVDPGDYVFTRDDDGTGEVVFAVAVTGEVWVYSAPIFSQTTEFQRFGSFFPDMVNGPLDKAAARDLWLKDRVDTLYPADGRLVADRIGMFLAWDADGEPITASGTGADDGLRTDLSLDTGFLLVKHKSALPNTYGRSGRQWAKVGGMEAHNAFNWIDDDLDPGVLDGSNATSLNPYLQNAFDTLAAGQGGSRYFPDATYKLTAPITFDDAILTGKHIIPQSRFGTIFRQHTDNTPHFRFDNVDLHHTWEWGPMTFTWLNPQAGNTDATVFRWDAGGGGNKSVYECKFNDLFVTNCDTVMRGDDIFWWGNKARGIWAANTGGFVKLGGGTPGGQPRNIFECYILGGAAGRYLFEVPAMVAEYHVEVNATEALMLADISAGQHTIRRWDLEGATYASNGTLFLCTNSIIHAPGLIRLDTMTITGTAAITGFNVGSTDPTNESHLEAANISVGADLDLAAGAKLTMFSSNIGPNLSTIKRIRAPWTPANDTTNGVCQLTSMGDTSSCAWLEVGEWLNHTRHVDAGDGSVPLVLDYDDPVDILIGKVPLVADLVILLPRHDGVVGNNLLVGPRFNFIKLPNAGTTYKADAKTYNSAATVATIPAAAVSGRKSVRYDRISLTGVGGIGHWTELPLPV